jgi:hypothetical protein
VRLDHLLSKEHWPHTPETCFRGVGSMTRAAGECSVGGLLISGALAIRFFLVDPRCEYCPSPFFGTGAGFRKSIGRMGWEGSSTLLGPEETDTRLFMLVLVVFRSPSNSHHLVGGAGLGVRAGPASIPHLYFSP